MVPDSIYSIFNSHHVLCCNLTSAAVANTVHDVIKPLFSQQPKVKEKMEEEQENKIAERMMGREPRVLRVEQGSECLGEKND